MKQGVGVLVISLTLIAAGARAQSPTPVSPSSRDAMEVVAGRCPTFHWTAVEEASSVDLVVYHVPVEDADGRAEQVLSVTLPGMANGWTPSLAQCLDSGKRYAWSVGIGGVWSDASLFEVSAAPSAIEVEKALEVLRKYTETESGQARPGAVSADGTVEQTEGARALLPPEAPSKQPSPTPWTREPVPAPGAPTPVLGTASLTVDQQIHLGADSHFFKQGQPVLWEDSSNTALGLMALAANTTGFQNTAIGIYALGSSNTGYRNTASGNYALLLNNDGHDNTASGYRALILNTASRNTAIGSRALQSNIAGHSNTAVGYRALSANASGLNTAVGAYALESNDTGFSNTAIGHKALNKNDTGIGNTATGDSALSSNTSGHANTANGYFALLNSEGTSNTASGHYALFHNTTGDNNTAVGKSALHNNMTGSNNIALGNGGGLYNTAGSNNISIGNPGTFGVDDSNTLRIGKGTGTDGFQQDRAFISGIRNAILAGVEQDVCVDGNDQVGPCSMSSRRFKEQVREVGDASAGLLALRPVLFKYKPEVKGEAALDQFGLIAEEVAEIYPALVSTDKEGRPFTVRYDLLTPLLLNELQKQHRQNQVQWALMGLMFLATLALARLRPRQGDGR